MAPIIGNWARRRLCPDRGPSTNPEAGLLGAKTPYLPRRIDAEDDFFYHGGLRGAVRGNTFFKPKTIWNKHG